MAKVMNLINAIDSNGKDYDVFLQDLLSANDDLPSDVDDVNNLQNAIISHINSRLNQSSTRSDGLNILLRMLPRCSKDMLSKYAILWITKASQLLDNSQGSVKDITLSCKVLSNLIVVCKNIPELQKHVSMQSVKQLVIAISNLEGEKKCGATFYLIGTILYHYREPSERLQTLIRKMILPLVDANQKNLVRAGANCYTLLARVTERSFKPSATKPTYTGWVYSQALLCNSLHVIMDDLFAGLIELDTVDIWEKLELPNISEDNVIEYYCGLERRFENLCIYLSTMLRGCSGKHSVSPNNILQVLCRSLAVTPASLRIEDSFKKQILYFILPKLHISMFSVLNAFIEGFQKELVPFAITILQLYQQTLKWTDKLGENQTTISGGKPFKNVRIAVYKSIATWLSYLGTLSGIELVAEDFLPHLLKDITPEKDRVLLTVQKTQHLSKRALKRYRDNQYENSSSLGSTSVVAKNSCINAELCVNALVTLEKIFFNANCALKQIFYHRVQTSIVPLLYDYYLGKQEDNFYRASNLCRLHLLKALKAIQLNPHPSTPPPTQYSIEILGMALKDVDLNIIQEAKLAIAELEKLAHPSAPTLLLPVRNVDEPGEKELNIHWSRPNEEERTSHENSVEQVESNVWDKFKELRNESITTDQGQRVKTGSEVTREDLVVGRVVTNGKAESMDGPTLNKQQKLSCNEPGERMDTSEDELVTSPEKDKISLKPQVNSTVYDSPRQNKIEHTNDGSRIEEEVSLDESNNASYLIPTEGQDNFHDSTEASQNSANDNEQTTNNDVSANGEIGKNPKVDETAEEMEQCLENNSDDEAIFTLFCDELKDQ